MQPFNLASIVKNGVVIPAIGISKEFFPFSPELLQVYPSIKAVLQDWGPAFSRLCKFADGCAAGASSVDPIPMAEATLDVPLKYPNKLLAVGANYADHLREVGLAIKRSDRVRAFFKPPTTCMVGPGRTVVKPHDTKEFDWEIELTAVIGARLKNADVNEAQRGIAGYTIVLDMSARDLLDTEPPLPADFVRGKGQDTMAPTGPVIVPAAFLGDIQNKTLKLWVNGIIRQQGSSANMLIPVVEIVSELSQVLTLEPGDHVTTGTPGGVGKHHNIYLKGGDKIAAEIEGIGTLNVEIVDAQSQ
jgi:2-keto-4-pentenoate hydratase/2-oxohepta-3-ene-1,7-dioic acid hydratase in catechol pathway